MIARLEAECAGAPPLGRSRRARRHSLAPLGSCLPAQFHLPRHVLVDGVRFLLRQSALFHMPHACDSFSDVSCLRVAATLLR